MKYLESFALNIKYLSFIFTTVSFLSCKTQTFTRVNANEMGILPRMANETDQQKYARWEKIESLFQYARRNKKDIFFPAGIYDVGARNFPFRTPESSTNKNLLDCGGITVYGEEGTVFMTSSITGADVLQLNKVKNITFKNLEITATLQNFTTHGSNGISITNGYDNINLENIKIHDLPGVDVQTWVDGSKGLTIQSDVGSTYYMGSVNVKNINIENVAYGFRMDTGYVSDVLKNYQTIRINIDGMTVKKAFQGFSMEFGMSLNNITDDMKLKINAKNINLIDCQQFVRFARVIGGSYTFHLSKTESNSLILKSAKNKKWLSVHDGIFGFISYYTKKADVVITGDVGNVDTKIWIGAVGNIVEAFNLKNSTEYNTFCFDIAGVSTDTDIRLISVGGKSVNNNKITVSKRTTENIPKEFTINSNIFKWTP